MFSLRGTAAEPEMPLWKANAIRERQELDAAKYARALLNMEHGFDYEPLARGIAGRRGLNSPEIDMALQKGAPVRDARARERISLKPDYERAEAMLAQNWPERLGDRKAADGSTMIGTGDLFMEYGRAVRNIARELGLQGNNYMRADETLRQEAGERYGELCSRISGTDGSKLDTLDILNLGMIEEALGLHLAYRMGLKFLYDAIETRAADEFRSGQEIVARDRNRRWQIQMSPNVASIDKFRVQ